MLKNYHAAFLSADRLSAMLAAHPPTTDAERTSHDDPIGFLGRWIGLLWRTGCRCCQSGAAQGPGEKFLDRLDRSQRPLLEDARNSVLSRFIEMTDESANARDRAAATARAEKEKTLAELQADKEKLDAREKELEERRTKLNSEFRAEMDEIAKQDQPLVQQQAQLTARANLLNDDLLGTSSQIATLQQLAAQEKNRAAQQQLFAETNALSLVAVRIEADLLGVNRLLRGVQGQRTALQTGRSAGPKHRLANRADRSRAGRPGQARATQRRMEKRANRSTVPSTGKVRSLSAQATALSTYDAFPLEAAKAKLLESLK